MTTAAMAEIAANFSFFQTVVASLVREHRGDFALLRAGEVVGVFATAGIALDAARRFDDGMFSIQKVVDRPLDLGFLSYASDERITA